MITKLERRVREDGISGSQLEIERSWSRLRIERAQSRLDRDEGL